MKSCRSRELLERLEDRGYPVEYLLSRIRGRRSKLISDWRGLVYEASPLGVLSKGALRGGGSERTAEGIWANLLGEHRWVYRQLNDGLRDVFAPYFLYAELRTLFICLRHVAAGGDNSPADLLAASLLSKVIKGIFSGAGTQKSVIEILERIFLPLDDAFGGLTRMFEDDGLRGVEQGLTNAWLRSVVNSGLHPVIRSFFARVIDSRNILGIYKTLRLNTPSQPPYLPGGIIQRERFDEMLKSGDLFAVRTLVRRTTGVRIDAPDITKVENALYRGITRYLRKEARDPLGVGIILEYLWRCSLEAMNLSLLVHTRDFEREAAGAELVY